MYIGHEGNPCEQVFQLRILRDNLLLILMGNIESINVSDGFNICSLASNLRSL